MDRAPGEEFPEAFARFAEMLRWFTLPGSSDDKEVTTHKVRLILAEWDSAVAPLLGHLSAHQHQQLKHALLPRLERLRAQLRLLYLTALEKAVEARSACCSADLLTRLPAMLHQLKGQAREEATQFIDEAFQRALGIRYEPETVFREGERLSDEADTAWERLSARLQREWEDDFTTETQARLLHETPAGLARWRQQIQDERAAILERHPQIRPPAMC